MMKKKTLFQKEQYSIHLDSSISISYPFLFLLFSTLFFLIFPSSIQGQTLTKKDFIYRNAPKNANIQIKKSILSTAQHKKLESSWNGILTKDSIVFITIRDEQKKLVRYIYFNDQTLPIYQNFYQVGVALDSNGIIKDVGLVGNYDMYGVAVASKKFLMQFLSKGEKPINLNKDLNGITGATMSVDLVTKSVNGVLGAYDVIFNKRTL